MMPPGGRQCHYHRQHLPHFLVDFLITGATIYSGSQSLCHISFCDQENDDHVDDDDHDHDHDVDDNDNIV